KLIVAKKAGFCYGVKKAVELAEKTYAENSEPIYSIGPLIHNRFEVQRLSKIGIKPVSSVNKVKKGTIIIRTHGIPRKHVSEAKKKKLNIIDATCPFVKRVQHLVKELSKKNFYVLIIGEKEHPEVKSLISYAEKPVKIIESINEIRGLSDGKKIAVVSQTTQSLEKFNHIIKGIKSKYKNAKIFNTICTAALERQEEAEKIAREVDVVLIIGGRNSANTARLVDICKKHTITYHIESAEEINDRWFDNVHSIGILAGASTPKWIIDAVISHMKGKDWLWKI
ncbi:MAG: 4-hydroxy-3-methylbut-2-enyl diphosphate reductase, partial [Elusimicrobia bacterium CG_4_10_14_0_8_um_filter_37_32]